MRRGKDGKRGVREGTGDKEGGKLARGGKGREREGEREWEMRRVES